jgi:flavin reductase (DIM6/NTAB) family NADH-FMN oxidoreductase RutF
MNIPSTDLVQKVDYVGLTSGRDVDKSKLFDVFYGELESAPMIKECPLNMECKVIDQLNFSKMEVFIGEVIQSYIGKEFLLEGKPNVKKINPLIYSLERKYYDLGKVIADGLSIGKTFQPEL